jgi:hypothetical protein
MGLDMTYQALPRGCDLIERAKADADFGSALSLLPIWYRRGGPGHEPDSTAARELWEAARLLAARHPGPERRSFSPGRTWDVLHYLLSAERREEPDAGEIDALFSRAVKGGEVLAGHLAGGQGIPIRYVTPEDVQAAARRLESMDCAALRAHYDPQRMEDTGVYKFLADWPGSWESICGSFLGFRAFYLEVARHGEGVLVCLD